jgi:hypothetical protein
MSATTVSLVVLVGAAAAVVALQRHVGGADQLRANQSASLGAAAAPVLSAARVQAFVVKAPEPVEPSRRTPAARVRCRPAGSGPLRDPWLCQIRYRSGTLARYRVVVAPDGRYRGAGSGIIEGCCIKTPAAG